MEKWREFRERELIKRNGGRDVIEGEDIENGEMELIWKNGGS